MSSVYDMNSFYLKCFMVHFKERGEARYENNVRHSLLRPFFGLSKKYKRTRSNNTVCRFNELHPIYWDLVISKFLEKRFFVITFSIFLCCVSHCANAIAFSQCLCILTAKVFTPLNTR